VAGFCFNPQKGKSANNEMRLPKQGSFWLASSRLDASAKSRYGLTFIQRNTLWLMQRLPKKYAMQDETKAINCPWLG